jgi:hypothetical protein
VAWALQLQQQAAALVGCIQLLLQVAAGQAGLAAAKQTGILNTYPC